MMGGGAFIKILLNSISIRRGKKLYGILKFLLSNCVSVDARSQSVSHTIREFELGCTPVYQD